MDAQFGNDPGKIEAYQRFWRRNSASRPLIGFSLKTWFPLDEFSASAAWPVDMVLCPDDVVVEVFLDDQDAQVAAEAGFGDDVFRGGAPARSIFWCCGGLDCGMRVLPGNIVAISQKQPWERSLGKKMDPSHPWTAKYLTYLDALNARAAGRYPIGIGSLAGPLDYAVAIRGHEQTVVDMLEEPETARRFLDEMTGYFLDLVQAAQARISAFYNGSFDAQYQLWAPGSSVRMQEDAIAVLSPDLYRDFIMPLDRRIASAYEYPFMHLHSSSMIVLDHLLELTEIKCFQVTCDVGGPALEQMLPYYARIQKAGFPLLLCGALSVAECVRLAQTLDTAGLYLNIMLENADAVGECRDALL